MLGPDLAAFFVGWLEQILLSLQLTRRIELYPFHMDKLAQVRPRLERSYACINPGLILLRSTVRPGLQVQNESNIVDGC